MDRMNITSEYEFRTILCKDKLGDIILILDEILDENLKNTSKAEKRWYLDRMIEILLWKYDIKLK